MIPQYSKKQILASYDEPLDTNVLWLHLQITKEFEKPILKYYSPHGWIPLNDSLWDFNVNGILTPKDNYKFSLTDAIEIKIQNGDNTLFLNEKGDFTKPLITHPALNGKNAEAEFQHVTQEEKTNFVAASDFVEALIENATSIAREDLLALINNNELIPNSSYRITDYTTTTTQTDTTSAGHDFDIIVTALSINKLSEIASCVRKADDTYFTNSKLEAWEIKYCINNDTSRFAWADTVNGKGVIYYMKDEWNNECPYDFKNIQYLKNSVLLYTFGGTADDSLTGGCHHNTIMDYMAYMPYTSEYIPTLNFNTLGNNCSFNTFKYNCKYNTFGSECDSNTFGIGCNSNTFGYDCNHNTINDGCYSNTFGDYCNSNTFGNMCTGNTLGNNCKYNTFGSECYYNNFYHGASGTTKKDFIRYIVLEDGGMNNNFYSSIITDGNNFLQRIRIKGLYHTTPTNIQITLPTTNTKYEWLIYYTTDGVLKQLSPDYSLINNYTYKIENTSVSTWVASTAYAGYGFQSQINIADLSEFDSVNVVFGLLDAISGNYAPAIEIYGGYILVFAKVNTTITIPTIEITKIDL